MPFRKAYRYITAHKKQQDINIYPNSHCIFIEKFTICAHTKKHKALRKKHKAHILKYVPYVLKYMACIFRLSKILFYNDLYRRCFLQVLCIKAACPFSNFHRLPPCLFGMFFNPFASVHKSFHPRRDFIVLARGRIESTLPRQECTFWVRHHCHMTTVRTRNTCGVVVRAIGIGGIFIVRVLHNNVVCALGHGK